MGFIFGETLGTSRTASPPQSNARPRTVLLDGVEKRSGALRWSGGKTCMYSFEALLLLMSTIWLVNVLILTARQVTLSTTPVCWLTVITPPTRKGLSGG